MQELYARLYAAHGPQRWWPARERFEILIGAVLTQNTAWTNVERAIANLRAHGLVSAPALLACAHADLERQLRPSGCYRVKTRRLRNLCAWFVEAGGFPTLDDLRTSELRRRLLKVNGVGRETADAILVYAFNRPLFVADAYARRILSRLGLMAGEPGYEDLRQCVETAAAGRDASFFNELHALLVAHGKAVCRATPLCGRCPLLACCATGSDRQPAA